MSELTTPERHGPRGNTIRVAKNGKTCIARTGGKRWSLQAEKAFLEDLTVTANVKAASAVAGFSPVTAYNQRNANPAFRARWDEAKATAVARLEMLVVHSASATLKGLPLDGEVEIPRMTIDQVFSAIKLHRASVHGGKPQRYSWNKRLPTIEEVQHQIMTKLAAIRRGRGVIAAPAVSPSPTQPVVSTGMPGAN